MVDPRQFQNSYDSEKQEKANSGFQMPPSGTYDVVNVSIQKMIVGAKRTEKRRIRCRIIGVHEEHEGLDYSDVEGMVFPFDLWWNMEKAGNVRRLAHLSAACGNADEFDENDDEALAMAITGVPYRMKLNVRERQHNGKTMLDADPVVTTHLPKKVVANYVKDPDFKEMIGEVSERILEPKDFSDRSSGGGGGSGGQGKKSEEQADPFDDSDLPF